jgi:hypothetical protein
VRLDASALFTVLLARYRPSFVKNVLFYDATIYSEVILELKYIQMFD